jgi:hypothetical protein
MCVVYLHVLLHSAKYIGNTVTKEFIVNEKSRWMREGAFVVFYKELFQHFPAVHKHF